MGTCCTANDRGPSNRELRDAGMVDIKTCLYFMEEYYRDKNVQALIEFIEDEREAHDKKYRQKPATWVADPKRIASIAMSYLYDYYTYYANLLKNQDNPRIIKETSLIKRLMNNLKSQQQDIEETALWLLSVIVRSKDDKRYLEDMRRPENYHILFYRLDDAGYEKRLILSRLIRHCYFQHPEATKTAQLYMVSYIKIIPKFTNTQNLIEHLHNIEDYYKPNNEFNLENFEYLCKCGLRDAVKALRFDAFEQLPSMKKDWEQIMEFVRKIRVQKDRRKGTIGLNINLQQIAAAQEQEQHSAKQFQRRKGFLKRSTTVNLDATTALRRSSTIQLDQFDFLDNSAKLESGTHTARRTGITAASPGKVSFQIPEQLKIAASADSGKTRGGTVSQVPKNRRTVRF